jgi:hypothetical protein
MEQNNVDNNNNVANPVQVNRPALANPARTHICGVCSLVSLGCLLIGAISMLIAGAYYYSIYAQHGGIDYRRKYSTVKLMS